MGYFQVHHSVYCAQDCLVSIPCLSSCVLTQCFGSLSCYYPQSVGRLLLKWVAQIFVLNHWASFCRPQRVRWVPTLLPEDGERLCFGNIVSFFLIWYRQESGNKIIQRVVAYVNSSFKKPPTLWTIPTCLSCSTWLPYVLFVNVTLWFTSV